MKKIQLNTIHLRIKELRLALKLNQDDFGQIINVTGSQIGQIETEKSMIKLESISKLSNYIQNLNLDWFLFGMGKMFENHTYMGSEKEENEKHLVCEANENYNGSVDYIKKLYEAQLENNKLLKELIGIIENKN